MEDLELTEQELRKLKEINTGLEAAMNGAPGPSDEPSAAEMGDGSECVIRQKSEAELMDTGAGKRHGRRLPRWSVVLLVLAIIAAGAFGALRILRWRGQNRMNTAKFSDGIEITAPEEAEIASDGRITYRGRYYVRNEDIISILGMGIDQDEDAEAQQVAGELLPGEQGQADTVVVLALDEKTGKLDLINISRDSMADVDVYNVDDEYVSTEKMQICLAYAYGGNEDESCANMVRAVSRLMYGIPINAYAAIDMPAIAVLNDAVGGVEVTVLEDLSTRDPELTEGAVVTLDGSQARTYVRARDHVSVDANNARMSRQRQYASAFLHKFLSAAKENLGIVMTLYQAVRDYMTTDIDLSEALYLAKVALKGDFSEVSLITVPGEVIMGDTYAEYQVDDTALYEILLNVFYVEVAEDGTPVEHVPETGTEPTPAAEEAAPPEEDTIVTVDRELLR